MSTEAVAVGESVQDPRSLGIAAQVLIGVLTVAQLAVGLAGGTRAGFYPAYLPINFALIVASAVLFLLWLRRCRVNAGVFAPEGHKHTPGMAVGAWFIPVANLWIPRRVVIDTWRASGPAGGEWLINTWWAAWLGKGAVAFVLMQTHAHPNGYSAYDQVIGVVSGALAILTIRGLTDRQRAKLTQSV